MSSDMYTRNDFITLGKLCTCDDFDEGRLYPNQCDEYCGFCTSDICNTGTECNTFKDSSSES